MLITLRLEPLEQNDYEGFDDYVNETNAFFLKNDSKVAVFYSDGSNNISHTLPKICSIHGTMTSATCLNASSLSTPVSLLFSIHLICMPYPL